jgi:MFS family permease
VKMVVTTSAPLLLAGPIAGVLADQVSRRRILVVGQLLRSALALAMLGGHLLGAQTGMFVLWAISLCVTRVLYTSRAASIRHLVRRHELVAADSLALIVGSVAGFIGASGGLLATRMFGPAALIGICVLHAIAGCAYCRIRRNLGGGIDHTSAPWTDALTHLNSAKIRYAILATSTHRFLFGVTFTASILIGERGHTGSPLSYASALASCGFGSFLGNTSSEWVNEKFPRRTLTTGAFMMSAILVVVGVSVGRTWTYLAVLGGCSFIFQNLRVCFDATVQSNAIAGAGGREFALYDLSHNLAFPVGVLTGLMSPSQVATTKSLYIAAITYLVLSGFFAILSNKEEVPLSTAGPHFVLGPDVTPTVIQPPAHSGAA